MEKLKCASFFAGVGGIDLGFQNNNFEVIYANEMDKNAVITYEENFDIKVDCRKIEDVAVEEIPDFDIMLAGFPCTSFSIAGYRKGFDDEKSGHLFFELERIFSVKKPRIIFLENVKNLISDDKGNTFKIIVETLEANGYKDKIKFHIMNAKDFGNVPQNRERIYIVAFREEEDHKNFNFPFPVPLELTIHDIVSKSKNVDQKYFYSYDNCKFYDKIKDEVLKKDTLYQWRRVYVRENKSNVCPTLTANMGTGGHNVPLLLTKKGVRKLTPKECFLFQGFPENYKLPQTIANMHLYKQAGNSVVVAVIDRIAAELAKVVY